MAHRLDVPKVVETALAKTEKDIRRFRRSTYVSRDDAYDCAMDSVVELLGSEFGGSEGEVIDKELERAVNRKLKLLSRRASARETTTSHEEEGHHMTPGEYSAEEWAEHLEFWRHLAARAHHHIDVVVENLPHEHRHLIVAHYSEGHKNDHHLVEHALEEFVRAFRRHLRVQIHTMQDDASHTEELHVLNIILHMFEAGTFEEFLEALNELD